VTPWIALGLEAGWQESEVSSASEQDLGLVPIMADIIVRFPNVHQTVVPYGVLGLGVVGAYVTDEDGVAPNNDGDDTDDTTFGWKFGIGADWFLNERWIINFEWAYFSADPDLINTQATDLDFWTLGAGIKYVY
jgi:opacity protein-like surface antigen